MALKSFTLKNEDRRLAFKCGDECDEFICNGKLYKCDPTIITQSWLESCMDELSVPEKEKDLCYSLICKLLKDSSDD